VLFWTRGVIVEYCFERVQLLLSTVLNTWSYRSALFRTRGVIVEYCFEHAELLLSAVLNTWSYC